MHDFCEAITILVVFWLGTIAGRGKKVKLSIRHCFLWAILGGFLSIPRWGFPVCFVMGMLTFAIVFCFKKHMEKIYRLREEKEEALNKSKDVICD